MVNNDSSLLIKKRQKKSRSDWQLPEFEVKEFFPKKTKYCLGIPIINEGERFKKQLSLMKKFTGKIDIIIFDGGSTDGSTDINFLKRQRVRSLLIKKSPGRQGTQLRMGFAYALDQGYEGVITIDGNGKDGVNAIPKFIDGLEYGFDLIQGSRYIKGGKEINTPLLRHIGNHLILSPMFSLASLFYFTDVTNGFRAYSKKLLMHPEVKPFRDNLVSYEMLFYLGVRAPQIGLKTKEVPVTRCYPASGRMPTKIIGFKSLLNVLKVGVLTAFGYYNP